MFGKLKISGLFSKERGKDTTGSPEAYAESARLLRQVHSHDEPGQAAQPAPTDSSQAQVSPQDAPDAEETIYAAPGQPLSTITRLRHQQPEPAHPQPTDEPAAAPAGPEDDGTYASPGQPLSTIRRYREIQEHLQEQQQQDQHDKQDQKPQTSDPAADTGGHDDSRQSPDDDGTYASPGQPLSHIRRYREIEEQLHGQDTAGQPDSAPAAPDKNAEDKHAADTNVPVAAAKTADSEPAVPGDAAADSAVQPPAGTAVPPSRPVDAVSLESDSDYAEPSVGGAPQKLPAGLQIMLWLRQLCASLFTHTNLSVAFPRLSLRLGPCYPSSMPLPYLLTGVLCGAVMIPLADFGDPLLTAGFYFVLLTLCTGIRGFSGMSTLLAMLARRRTDHLFESVCAVCYCVSHIGCFTMLLHTFAPGAALTLACGIICMTAAWSATLLNFGLRQDPMEFFGSMTFSGAAVCTAAVFAVCFTVLNPFCATVLCGAALLTRLGIGAMLYATGQRASRDRVCGAQLIAQLVLMAALTVCGRFFVLLNPWIFPGGTL